MFAPKPLAMSGAKDWTIDIETKGLPELKKLYRLYDRSDLVMAKCYPQFGHNYNQVARELMYNWFNRHLGLGHSEPVVENPFEPVPPKELSVYDTEHPRPSDAVDAGQLRQYMTQASDKQLAALRPRDEAKLKEFRRVVGAALKVMVDDHPSVLPIESEPAGSLDIQTSLTTTTTGVTDAQKKTTTTTTTRTTKIERLLLSPPGSREQVPVLLVSSAKRPETLVIWVHSRGKRSLFQGEGLSPEAQRIVDSEAAILAPDVFMTGEFNSASTPQVNSTYAGYTFGYNRPLLAQRVHDILTVVQYGKQRGFRRIHLVGIEKAGPWVVLARALCGTNIERAPRRTWTSSRFERIRHPR